MMRNTHSPSSILICTLHTVGTLPYEVCTIREFLGPLQLGFLRVFDETCLVVLRVVCCDVGRCEF